jgi:aspartate kinase
VVSAPGKRTSAETKLTDLFYSVYDLASKKLDFSIPFDLIRQRFNEIALDLKLNTNCDSDLDNIYLELTSDPESISVDYVVSRGEYLSAKLMAEFLGATFIDAFDLIQVDIHKRVTTKGYQQIAKRLEGFDLVVVPGFYHKSADGELRTFSRGGSDITGSILAHSMNASMYENWTDVSGLLMADPRIVAQPKPMESISYREIRELAYSGANVFHDEAIVPCKIKGIPVNIRNTNQPEDPGTIIGPVPENPENIVTGIAGRKHFSMIYMEKNLMNQERGFGRKAMGILETHNVSFEHAPTGIDSMSILVKQNSLKEVKGLVLEELENQLSPDSITITEDIALITTVGHGMNHHVGTAAKLFSALAEDSINVRIIDQGSSEINIIIGVDHIDYEKSIKSIYTAFIQG